MAALAVATALAATNSTPHAQGTPQVLLQETFRGPTTTSAVLSLDTGAPGFPCLTADPAGAPAGSTIPNCGLAVPDVSGAGALRFTAVTEQQASGFVAETSLPTAQGLSIAFTQYQYGGYGIGGPGVAGGGDGIAFFLAVAPPHPEALGPQGGALGYASAGAAPGLPGGWLGIGLDAFGNYSNSFFGGASCVAPPWAGFNPESITVRGPGHGTEGYCLLESSANEAAESLADTAAAIPGDTLRGDDRASSARRIRVDITPGDGLFRVYVDAGAGFELAVSGALPDAYYDPTTGALVPGLPPRITFGFSASTGSATDIHEIADLTASTVSGGVPVLGLAKTTSLTAAPAPGEGFDYVITPRIDGTAPESAPLSLRVDDTLPAGVSLAGGASGSAWLCLPTSPSSLSCAYTDPSPIPAGTVLPAITVPVTIDAGVAPGTTIRNTATALSDDAAQPVEAWVDVTVATPPPPLQITTTALPGGRVDAAYSTTLTATGGTGARTWTVDAGELPPGLTLSAAGTLSGTPTADGTFPVTVRVTDAVSATTTRALSIAVAPAPPPLVITTTSLPGGTVGTSYNAALAATGGTGARTWTLDAGALPGGLSLSPAGTISGTPTAVATVAFTVRVTDADDATATRALSIAIVAATADPPVITTTSLPTGEIGVGYAAALAASGGTAPLSWTLRAGALPAGLSLSPAGVISGVPTVAGAFTVTVRVTDGAGRFAQRGFFIGVRLALGIFTTRLPNGRAGVAYRAVLRHTGGLPPVTWSIASGALPPGLGLAPDGVISGRPTAPGTFTFGVRAADALGGVAARQFAVTIARAEKAYVAVQLGCQPGPGQSCPLVLGAIELPAGRLVATIPVPAAELGARMLTAHPDGSRVFVVTDDWAAGPVLHEIDTTTDAIRRSLPIATAFGVPVLAPNGARVYTFARTPVSTAGIGYVDTATFTYGVLSGGVGVGAGPLVVSPDSGTLYVAGTVPGTSQTRMLTISVSTGLITRSLTTNYAGLLPGATTPGGGRVLLPYQFRNGVGERGLLDYRPLTNRTAGPIPTGTTLLSLAVPTPSSLWAVELGGSNRTIVNYSLLSDSLVRRVTTAGFPDALAVDSARDTVYVLTRGVGGSPTLERVEVAGGGASPVLSFMAGGFNTATHLAIARAGS